MGFLVIGLGLLGLYLAGIEPVANWHWLWIALPFGAAAAWWAYADASGLTRRRAERQIEQRKQARRQRDLDALGLGAPPETSRRPGGRDQATKAPNSSEGEERGRRDPRL